MRRETTELLLARILGPAEPLDVIAAGVSEPLCELADFLNHAAETLADLASDIGENGIPDDTDPADITGAWADTLRGLLSPLEAHKLDALAVFDMAERFERDVLDGQYECAS